jgi:hypothetical protein
MTYPVTTKGSFTCANGGSPTLSSQAKLTVAGKPVMPYSAVSGLGTYTGCNYSVGTVSGPCTTTTVVSGGKAAKLTVAAEAALLDSIKANAGNPPPSAPVTVKAGQTKLTAS